MVCAKPEKECPKVSSCNCCGNFTCFFLRCCKLGGKFRKNETKQQHKHNTWEPHVGRKTIISTWVRLEWKRFWVNKWMVNECFFWKDHLFEPFSLYNLCCLKSTVGLFSGSQVASKGDETNPLKACGWFSGWSFPLGRCWVIKVSGWKRYLSLLKISISKPGSFWRIHAKKRQLQKNRFSVVESIPTKFCQLSIFGTHFWDKDSTRVPSRGTIGTRAIESNRDIHGAHPQGRRVLLGYPENPSHPALSILNLFKAVHKQNRVLEKVARFICDKSTQFSIIPKLELRSI